MEFVPQRDADPEKDFGEIHVAIKGLWLETILYEIPLLALVSEAYFKFVDKDWSYDGQEERAFKKSMQLLENGVKYSEFGSRRRRDYHTQDLVLQGLKRGVAEGGKKEWKGALTGTSNVHFAMKHGISAVGTVAHEWFMGIAAITNDYANANETAMRYWVGTFGEGVLGIALTDTFGTPQFLKAFKKECPKFTVASTGVSSTTPSSGGSANVQDLANTTDPPMHAPPAAGGGPNPRTFAEVFAGVRQDSGDPVGFVKMMRDFYDEVGIKERKTIVFSDSLNVELCIEYMSEAEEAGFNPTFGVGTFLTSKRKPSSMCCKLWK